MLFLLALLILGIVWVASALIDNDAASMESLYGKFCVIYARRSRDTFQISCREFTLRLL